jgi:predicted GNAT family acetyltransferase
LFNSSGVVGLHAVNTLPNHRNKGFGAKISGYALIDGLKMGYKMAVLHASDMGMRVYQKLGFDKYGDIYSYELP